MAEADISKIISAIMENPALVEEIRSLAIKSEEQKDTQQTKKEEPAERTEEAALDLPHPKKASRRNDLLRAMRPYLSEERGRAIESMITIADIIFAIKEK